MIAIKVNNAFKQFEANLESIKVLNNLSMNVERGSIYAMMGSSGCGKTTLISSLVGLLELDGGVIEIFGEAATNIDKLRVGYMPQENSLITEFTVGEMVWFMGTVFGLSSERIRDRMKFLSELLELPDRNKLIRECSGGQQRRVSFALTLIHEPELLILDEPTVGLDPLLRNKIWNYLIELTETKKVTILLTTHYIEEAKQSTRIGLMRNGEMIAEDSAENIMRVTECDSLDEAFLQLSERQERGDVEQCSDYIEMGELKLSSSAISQRFPLPFNAKLGHGRSHRETSKPQSRRKQTNFMTLIALFIKNMLQLLRNIDVPLTAIMVPIAGCICLHFAIGGRINGLTLGIVDEEISALEECRNDSKVSRNFDDFECVLSKASSCRFINELKKEVDIQLFATYNEAFDSTKSGTINGFVQFTSNFTQSLSTYVNHESIHKFYDDNAIQIILDQTDFLKTLYLKKSIFDTYESFSASLMVDCGRSARAGSLPMAVTPLFGVMELEVRSTLIPGPLLAALFTSSAFILSTSMNSERISGIWNRCLVAGVTSTHFLISHLIEGLLMLLLQLIFNAIYSIYFLSPSLSLSAALLICMLLLFIGLVGLLFGLLSSIVMKTQLGSYMMAEFAIFQILYISGALWPYEAMPRFVQLIANFLPLTHATTAFRNIAAKGANIFDTSVYLAFITLGVHIILLLIYCIWLNRAKSCK